MAGKAKQVYGVEIVPQAIDDARENAKRNGITNAEFFVGKAEEVLPAYYAGNKTENVSRNTSHEKQTKNNCQDEGQDLYDTKQEMLHPDVIVVDPPRKGCDEACLSTMLKMQP